MDLDRKEVFADLLVSVRQGRYSYVHFGLPCTSWGLAGILSGGYRRKHRLYGDPGARRECRGNLQAERMTILIHALSLQGAFWSVENPQASFFWDTFYFEHVESRFSTALVSFDQCTYGLQPPDAGPAEFTKKATCWWTNLDGAHVLGRRCPGCSASHRHLHAWGSGKANGKAFNRA